MRLTQFKPYNIGTANVLLPEKINEGHLGMDTRDISEPYIDIMKIHRNFELYRRVTILENSNIHPMNNYRVASLYLEELLYNSDDMPSRLTIKPTYGGLFKDWIFEKK